jgi:hypothetical protein
MYSPSNPVQVIQKDTPIHFFPVCSMNSNIEFNQAEHKVAVKRLNLDDIVWKQFLDELSNSGSGSQSNRVNVSHSTTAKKR